MPPLCLIFGGDDPDMRIGGRRMEQPGRMLPAIC